MRSTILILAPLLATSLALPQGTQRRHQKSDTKFLIENYNPGCGDSPAGCFYSFNLTIEKPGLRLSTSCHGVDVQFQDFNTCTDSKVTTQEFPESFGYFTLFVNYTFSDGYEIFKNVGSVNITNFEDTAQNFTIVPKLIRG